MIHYTSSLDGIGPDQLEGFFEASGWSTWPSPEMHLRLLRQSDEVVLARDGGTRRVVGYITAISDGVLSAYIPLLEVLPEWQGQGIGSELTRQMLDRLSHLYMVDLLCDADVQPFYERLGMRRATGMMIRNYSRQTGATEGEV